MRSMTPTDKQKIADNQQNKIVLDLNKLPADSTENNAVTEILSAGGCENFSDYVRDLGLSNDPDLVVLSSFHHYYYDAEEMKNVRSVSTLLEDHGFKVLGMKEISGITYFHSQKE